VRRVAPLLLIALAAVLVLAACGGGSGGDRLTKQEYEQQVSELGKTVANSFGGLSDSSSPEEAGKSLDAARQGIDELADRLDDVSPPEEIQAAHDKLVDGLRRFSDDLDGLSGKLRDAAESNDPAAAVALLGEFATLESVKTLEEAQKEFEAKGYDLGFG
jgi:hypothetical protein